MNTKIIPYGVCEVCFAEVTKICSDCSGIVCESCHERLNKECIDEHGSAVRDNTPCQRVAIIRSEE